MKYKLIILAIFVLGPLIISNQTPVIDNNRSIDKSTILKVYDSLSHDLKKEETHLSLSSSHFKYNYQGTLIENGDIYLDDSEYTLYHYEVKSDEIFSAELELTKNVDVSIVYFKGSTIDDLLNVLNKAVNTGNVEDIYALEITEQGLASFSFKATKELKGSVVIISLSETPVTLDYNLGTSIPKGDRTSFVEDVLPTLIIVGIIIAVVVYFIRRRNRTSKIQKPYYNSNYRGSNYQYPPNYNQIGNQNTNRSNYINSNYIKNQSPNQSSNQMQPPSYYTPNSKNSEPINEHVTEPSVDIPLFCANCGSQNDSISNFCRNCGSKLDK